MLIFQILLETLTFSLFKTYVYCRLVLSAAAPTLSRTGIPHSGLAEASIKIIWYACIFWYVCMFFGREVTLFDTEKRQRNLLSIIWWISESIKVIGSCFRFPFKTTLSLNSFLHTNIQFPKSCTTSLC